MISHASVAIELRVDETDFFLLHDDFAGHAGVNGTVILERSLRAKNPAERALTLRV